MNRAWHLSAWGFVNGLFLVKYGVRVHPLLPLAGLGILLAGILATTKVARTMDRGGRSGIVPWIVLAGFAAVSGLCFWKIPVHGLRVDRFDMIAVFWENIGKGIDPYTPRIPGVTNIPSQFPSYFLLALPFHLLGEVGWIPVAAVASMGWILWNGAETTGRRSLALALLVFSPALWWEVVCRSTIFANSLLCLVAVLPILRRPANAPRIGWAFLLGLAMSTRSVALQMILPVVLSRMRGHLRSWILPGLAWGLVPVVTVLPLLLLYRNHQWNPFEINAWFLPSWVSAGVLTASIAVANLKKDGRWALSVTVFGLDLLVLVFAGIVVFQEGWREAFFGSRLDISYFLLGSPFHLFLWSLPDGDDDPILRREAVRARSSSNP